MSMNNLSQCVEHLLQAMPTVPPHTPLSADPSVSLVSQLLLSMHSRGRAHPVSDSLSHFMRVCVTLFLVSTANRQYGSTATYMQAMLQALAQQLKASGGE